MENSPSALEKELGQVADHVLALYETEHEEIATAVIASELKRA